MFIMAEKVEKGKKEEKDTRVEKAGKNVKKLLATGILAGGLLLSPVQKAESIGFDASRAPPYYASELIEKDKDINVRLGWMAVMKIKKMRDEGRHWTEQEPYYEMAVNYFKHAYEKNKTPENSFLYCHALYENAARQRTYEGTEERELEVINLIEERLKEQPNDMDFIDLKQIIYYNLAIMYYRAAVNFNDERGSPSELERKAFKKSDILKYKEKAIEYIKKWLEFNEWVNEHWDEFEFFAWRIGYDDAAKEKGIILKQYFEECKESLRTEYTKDKEELNRLLKSLEKY